MLGPSFVLHVPKRENFMSRRISISAKFTVPVALLFIAVMAATSIVLFFSFRASLDDELERRASVTTALLKQEFESWLGPKYGVLKAQVVEALDAYPDSGRIKRVYGSFLKQDKEMLDNYFGDTVPLPSGGIMVLGSGSALPASYDQTGRGWYKAAAASQEIIATAPYIDAFTGKLVITLALRADAGSKLLGVAGIDIEASKISTIASSKKLSGNGTSYMIGSDGLFVTHED